MPEKPRTPVRRTGVLSCYSCFRLKHSFRIITSLLNQFCSLVRVNDTAGADDFHAPLLQLLDNHIDADGVAGHMTGHDDIADILLLDNLEDVLGHVHAD